MAFPPPKKKTGPPSADKGPPRPPGPPAPDGPPQGDLMSAMMGGGGMPPTGAGMPPMGGPMGAPMPPTGGPPGMPPPGQGMDPMAAMMGGMGMPPGQDGVMGPDGMPLGGSMPGCDDGDCGDMGGSDLMSALGGSLGDPYAQPAGTNGLSGLSDPQGGGDMAQLIQLLALQGLGMDPSQMMGGGGAGSSGVGMQGYNPGGMMGM